MVFDLTLVQSSLSRSSDMTLLSSHLFPFSSVHRRSPATTTTTFPWNKPTTTNDTVKFLYSPSVHRSVRLDERFVTRFIVPANAQDLIHNVGATVGVLGGAYALVFSFDDLTRRNIIDQVILSFLQFIFLLCNLHAYMHTISKKNIWIDVDPFFLLLLVPFEFWVLLIFCFLMEKYVLALKLVSHGDGRVWAENWSIYYQDCFFWFHGQFSGTSFLWFK